MRGFDLALCIRECGHLGQALADCIRMILLS